MGTRGSFPGGVKRPGRESDHSLPSSAEVKNGGAIPPLPHTSSWRSAQLITGITNFLYHFPYFEKKIKVYEITLLSVSVSLLSLLGKGSVNTFPRQRTVERIVFYAVRIVSKESRRLVLSNSAVSNPSGEKLLE
jgi:hypothetical protein